MRRLLAALLLGMVLTVAPVVPADASPDDPAADEARFVALINQLRASKGLAPLRVDAGLRTIGRRWAAKMAEAGRISHNRNFPNEVTSDWAKLGENVGVGGDVDELHDAFVRSPAHYRNLVDGDFEYVGVGVVWTADGSLYTSHQFMKLRPSAAPAAKPAPRAAPARPARSTAPPKAAPVVAQPAAAAPPAPAPAPTMPARVAFVLEELRRIGATARTEV